MKNLMITKIESKVCVGGRNQRNVKILVRNLLSTEPRGRKKKKENKKTKKRRA